MCTATSNPPPLRTVQQLAVDLVAGGVESLDPRDADVAEVGDRLVLRAAIGWALDFADELRADPGPVLALTRRTGAEWQVALPQVRIVDADGWGGGRAWSDRIPRREYLARRALCTVEGSARSVRGSGGPAAEL